jgi:hypothetical protein
MCSVEWNGGRKWIMAYFKVLSQHLPWGTKENHRKIQDSQSLGQDLNSGPPKYKAEVSGRGEAAAAFSMSNSGETLLQHHQCLTQYLQQLMSRKKLWRAWLTLYLRFKSSLWSKVQLCCILRNNYLTLNLDKSELFTGLCMLNLSSSCNKKTILTYFTW